MRASEIMKSQPKSFDVHVLDNLSDIMSELQKQICRSESYTLEQFESEYSEEREICKTLGSNGWVVSQYVDPRTISEWYEKIRAGDADSFVLEYFERNNGELINDILNYMNDTYTNLPEHRYYKNGIYAFNKKDYMTAAMYFFPLFESRNAKLLKPKGRYNSSKYSNNGLKEKRTELYTGSTFFKRRFLILDMFSSLIAFLKRCFVEPEEYKIDGGKEPPYLNRNWLLHGRMEREVTKCDCVQLMNAISVQEFIGNR